MRRNKAVEAQDRQWLRSERRRKKERKKEQQTHSETHSEMYTPIKREMLCGSQPASES